MKKMIGLVALCVIGLALAASAQEAAPAPAASSLESAATSMVATVAPAVQAAASAVESAATAMGVTVKGKVSVVKNADGTLQAIYINPVEGHGYKVDILNGAGKNLADKAGQIVEVTGVDVNRLLNVKTISAAE